MSIETEKTITLRKPFSFGTVEYTEIQLTEPTVGQLRAAYKAGAGMDVMATLTSLVAKIPLKAVDQMSQQDFGDCISFFDQFNADSTSSEALTPAGQ